MAGKDSRRGRFGAWCARLAERTFSYGTSRAVVVEPIPAGTVASPSSSGRAQIYRKGRSGEWAPSGDPVVVWNQNALPEPLPRGLAIFVDPIGGDWWVTSGSCA